MTIKMPQAVFGGLALIALAIYFGPGSKTVDAHGGVSVRWFNANWKPFVEKMNREIIQNLKDVKKLKSDVYDLESKMNYHSH